MDLDAGGWWVAVPADVVRCSGLSVMARLLHVILMSYRNPQKPQEAVFPRADTLAGMLSVCEKTVSRAMKELLDAKIIERKRRMGRSTLTFLKATGFVLPTGHPVHPVPDTHVSAEEEPEKKSHTPYVATPRGEVSENPTATEPPRERVIVPAEDEVPYRPLARQKKPPSPKYQKIGARARLLWASQVVEAGAGPPMATWSAGTLVKAGQTIAALKDSPFADKSIEEVFALLVGRIKTVKPIVRNVICFGWVFCAEDNLARLLAGDWDSGEREEVGPKKRQIPIDDVFPGMGPKDEEEYWRQKDAAQGKEEGDL